MALAPSGISAPPVRRPAEGLGAGHIAFIVDGNRRWAQAHGLSTVQGHQAGAQRIVDVLRWCDAAGVRSTSWWLLSPDNLQRPASELAGLLAIIGELANKLMAYRRWPIRHIGDPTLLPDTLARTLAGVQETTRQMAGPPVNLAIGYSGRRDITAAVRELAVAGTAITQASIAAALSTGGSPDPDLVIRTSGEQRLSDFMIWQTALAELYFSPVMWPDFTHAEFTQALDSYAHRRRRFGV
ncbi:polyprenyl diphosphate synthase [Streptomyces sp. NPDC020096]